MDIVIREADHDGIQMRTEIPIRQDQFKDKVTVRGVKQLVFRLKTRN